MALQHNINGVGYQAFEDLCNQSKHSKEELILVPHNEEKIIFEVILNKEDTDCLENINSFEFSIATPHSETEEPLASIQSFANGFASSKIAVTLKSNKDSWLFVEKIKEFIPILKAKGAIKIRAKGELGGENVELNFLPNKASMLKKIEVTDDKKTIEFEKRKPLILQCLKEFLEKREKD